VYVCGGASTEVYRSTLVQAAFIECMIATRSSASGCRLMRQKGLLSSSTTKAMLASDMGGKTLLITAPKHLVSAFIKTHTHTHTHTRTRNGARD
jgi:hypothetical protein